MHCLIWTINVGTGFNAKPSKSFLSGTRVIDACMDEYCDAWKGLCIVGKLFHPLLKTPENATVFISGKIDVHLSCSSF